VTVPDRSTLPIFDLETEIVQAMRENSRIIVQAPTGSGKSTQVPQILLDHGLLGRGQIVILQPRRLAARLLATRVAQERAVQLGRQVGYQIRFENVTSNETRIRFVTEGILLRQLIDDPQLRDISAILFDEFHERHLYGDITLARALQLQQTSRPDLKIGVMSATLDVPNLEKYLAPTRVLTSSGRVYPVTIEYLEKPFRAENYAVWDLTADELDRLASKTEGDVLVFMPGKYEIDRTISAIRASRMSDRFVALPLYGELPPREQDAALARYEKRKAIVATNVAETSLTIEGVQVVIDSGLARIARYDPRRGINTLLIEKISRASAEQRAGRAGRTAPGHCLRLWTQREHLERPAQELPEVKRLDLAEVVLTLKASGIDDVANFRWLEPPDFKALERAEELLVDLGALGSNTITPLGRRMLAFPVHPRYARMFLATEKYDCVQAVALIAALTQGRNLLRRAESKQVREDRDDLFGGETESDLFVLMRAFRFAQKNQFDPRRCSKLGVNAQAAREAEQLHGQFLDIARAEGLKIDAGESRPGAIQHCILAGFPDQVAVRLDKGTLRCALVHNRHGLLARESAVHNADLIVASEIREIESSDKERQVLLTLATKIEEEWLRELFPEAFHDETIVAFDSVQRRVVGRRETRFHDLTLHRATAGEVSAESAAAILAREVFDGNLVLKNWDNAIEQWMARVHCLTGWFPELELPRIGAPEKLSLLEQICLGAFSYREIKERAVWPVVKSWLSPAQQRTLDELAPEKIKLAGGKWVRITYSASDPPTIAARIQDLYGVKKNLSIGRGKIPLRIQVLAPNHRPIQITDDLENFWRATYPKIKKELQRKYPKHEWRDL
jgi:ATP-dependent helicase HrpB